MAKSDSVLQLIYLWRVTAVEGDPQNICVCKFLGEENGWQDPPDIMIMRQSFETLLGASSQISQNMLQYKEIIKE